MEEINPLVFISYSHDTSDHKKWVANLASKLLENGVDVMLDQWDLVYGDDLPKFMEKGVTEANRVLMVCTEPYVHKANDGQGGVGYEAMIVTGEIVRNLGTSKFIPIIKQNSTSPQLPTSVSTRLYINLSNEGNFEAEFDKLLRDLHKTPAVKKPPLGANPYRTNPKSIEPTLIERVKDQAESSSRAMKIALSDYNTEAVKYYENARNILASGDLVEWRKLIFSAKKEVHEAINAWRSQHETTFPSTWQEILPVAVSGAATYSSLIAIALAGAESGQVKFNNQRAILDEILYPSNWNKSGRTLLVDFPTTLAYVYQGLHGATCLATGQLDIAFKLITASIEFPNLRESIPFWRHHGAMGWPEAFEGKCTTAWSTLSNITTQWTWLNSIFGDANEFKVSLCAYYMALNLYEYIDTLSSGNIEMLSEGKLRLEIPLCFESEDRDIKRKAYSLLTRNPEALINLWRSRNIDDITIKKHWDSWLKICNSWLGNVYQFGFHSEVTHKKLIDELLSQQA